MNSEETLDIEKFISLADVKLALYGPQGTTNFVEDACYVMQVI